MGPDSGGGRGVSISASGSKRFKGTRRAEGADLSGGKTRSSGGAHRRTIRRKSRERSHGSRSGARPQWKVLAAIALVCAATAFIASVLLGADYGAMVNYYLFGDPNPKISAGRHKELENEFKDMLKKEFKGG